MNMALACISPIHKDILAVLSTIMHSVGARLDTLAHVV